MLVMTTDVAQGSSGYWLVPNTSDFQRIFASDENKFVYFFPMLYILCYSLELCKNNLIVLVTQNLIGSFDFSEVLYIV